MKILRRSNVKTNTGETGQLKERARVERQDQLVFFFFFEREENRPVAEAGSDRGARMERVGEDP